MTSALCSLSHSLTFPILHTLRYAVIMEASPVKGFLPCPSTATSKQLCSTGSSSAAIPMLTHGRIACISRPARRQERPASGVYTRRYGRRRMGRSRQGTRFTTATGTPWTIRRTTWNACRPGIITGTTGTSCQRSSDRRSGNGSSGSGRWLRRGIARKMGGAGIGSWAAGRGKGGGRKLSCVSDAGRATAHGRFMAPIGSVRIGVGRRRGGQAGWMMLFAIANGAVRSSPSTGMRRRVIAHGSVLPGTGGNSERKRAAEGRCVHSCGQREVLTAARGHDTAAGKVGQRQISGNQWGSGARRERNDRIAAQNWKLARMG